jgi:phenylacetate-CoA ligase
MTCDVTNIVIAGLGGQGVIKASDIIAEAAIRAGFEVKKSELHGMSQRGGSVSSDVRFGPSVFSPMVPTGEADFLIVVDPDQVSVNRHQLRNGGVLITPSVIDEKQLTVKKSLNIALLGELSRHLPIAEKEWLEAIRTNLSPKLQDANLKAFALGRANRGSALTTATPAVRNKTPVSASTGPRHPASEPDFIPIENLREVQLQRLQFIARRAYERVPLYRQRMDGSGVKPDDIRSLDDVARLPFTQKADLRDTYPFGLFASPLHEVVRLHASSGTTGKPIVVAYTREDVAVWTNVMMRAFASYGLHEHDIIQNAYGYGLFTGGLGAHYGAEALGATVIPISGGNTERQIMVMKDFGVTAICCTPSYFLHLIEKAQEMGEDLHQLSVRVGVFGAEPWTEGMRQRIEAESGIKAYDIYGLSEIVGPGVGSECERQCGLHIFEDHFYPEIVDPETGKSLPDGAEGELVFTTLSKLAMPMIRYRTHDITALMAEPCACGRTIRRIRRISRRSDDMLIIRGVNVFPSQIESALLRIEQTLPHYQIVLTRESGLDQMEVHVEVTPQIFSDEVRALEELHRKLTQAIETVTGIHIHVRLVAPRTLQRSEGKAKRVLDRRNEPPR